MSAYDAHDAGNDGIEAGLLSDATLTALQLRRQPFTDTPADGDHFADDTTADQLADIKQALITGDDLLLVLGEPGAGKSTLLTQLGANSGLRIQCFSVRGSARFSTQNLFGGMLEAFKQTPPDDLKEMLDALVPCLQGMVGNNILSAIVLDNADRVGDAELTRLLSSMLYLNSQDETLLRVALAADEAFEARIPELLPEGADLPYSSLSVEPFDNERAGAYLEFRLNQAGWFEAFPFGDREVAAMNERAGGRPRALHAEAASTLEAGSGIATDVDLPPELMSSGGAGLAGGRGGKLALGGLALALILGGLLLFRPGPPAEESPSYTVVENRPVTATGSSSDADNGLDLVDADTAVGGASTAAPTDEAAGSGSTVDGTEVASDDGSVDVPTEAPLTAPVELTGDGPSDEELLARAPVTDAPSDEAEPPATTTTTPSPETDAAPEPAEAPTPVPAPTPEPEPVSEPDPEPVPPSEPAPVADSEDTSGGATDGASDAPPVAEAPAVDGALGRLESPTWILVQDAGQFTVQMSASTDRSSVENFLSRTQLEPPNSIFAFDRDGTTWYALVHGLYPSIDEARTAVERMPAAAQSNQPWIRAVGRIQDALKDQG